MRNIQSPYHSAPELASNELTGKELIGIEI